MLLKRAAELDAPRAMDGRIKFFFYRPMPVQHRFAN
jgi:hypothetical protein